MTSSSAVAAAIPAAPSSTLSPDAVPFTLRAPPVCAPPRKQDGDASRSIDDNTMIPSAYFEMKSCDAVYPAGAHGVQSQPSSSSGMHANAYPSSASSTSAYTWMASESKQEQFSVTSGSGRSGNKSTKVTIKCPPDRILETNRISSGSKSKLAIGENDGCNNETGRDFFSCRNLEFGSPANVNGSSQGTMELNPVLKPLCIPSTHASSRVSVADDVNPDPSECSVDSPCWQGALASRVSSLHVLQTSDDWEVQRQSVDFCAGRSRTVRDSEASTATEKLVACKSNENHSHSHVEFGISEKPEDDDTNMKNDSHGKEVEHAKHGAGKCNAEHRYCLEARNNCMNMKRSGLNSPCSSTGRNTSEILKAIKSQSDMLQNNYSDDIKLEEQDLSILQSTIENLQSYLQKARKGPVKVASDKAGLKACHSQNAVSKSVTVNQNGIYTADKETGIIISNMAECTHSPGEFGRNSATGYQPARGNFPKESSCDDEHSQVLIFKNLWIDAVRANCALQYQLKQTRMAIDLESSMTHNGDGPSNPSFQLCDMVTDPSSSVGVALTCAPMLKDHPVTKTPNLIYVGNDIHSGDNKVLSRSKDSVLKNIQPEHLMSDLEDSSICRGLQPVRNKYHMGLNSSISDGVISHSYISRRDGISPASCLDC